MRQDKFVLCVDMDDTIEDLVPAWVDWLNKHHDTHVAVEDITNWNIAIYFPTLTYEEVFAPLSQREFWKTVKPKEDAINYLSRLAGEGVEVYICTSAYHSTITYKIEEVVEKYFSFIDWGHIIIAENKSMVRCDAIIDDAIHNLENHPAHRLLYTTPVNKEYNASLNGLVRVDDWRQAYRVIKLLQVKSSE